MKCLVILQQYAAIDAIYLGVTRMAREQGENISFTGPSELRIFPAELAGTVGGAAIAATEAQVVTETPVTTNIYGMMVPTAETTKRQEHESQNAARIEALKILDKDAFKLGDLNPLIHPTDLGRKESIDAVRHITLEKIRENEGLLPNVLESTVVIDPESGKADLRFIARFEVASLTPIQMEMLEELVRQTYGISVRTRTDSKGNKIPAQDYPPTQPGEEMRSKTGGWYMGPAPVPTSSLHQGLFVFKDYGPINDENFLEEAGTPLKFVVEVREASKYQTDLVTFVTQIASILSGKEPLDRGQLLYETYYDLILLGLKNLEKDAIYGMEEAKSMIMRELVIPLASPEISEGVHQEPQSVLMIGVPGTGKTLVAEWLLQEETGLFILPIDPFELQKEVAKPKEEQYLMPRIAEIARITGKQVVLHVDDIENMVGEHESTNSTMLNLMAGVQESGFYIIASTNYPEKINSSLIQPQRFSVLIHCGLQSEQARYEILKIHANSESKRLSVPLFSSEEVRDLILHEVASHTDGFTPRFLANIATIAKSHLIQRVAKTEGKTIGLTEDHLNGHLFTSDDWEQAFAEVDAKYDSKSVKQRDEELAGFVQKHSTQTVGFIPDGSVVRRVFSKDFFSRVAAAEARSKQS